MGEGNELDMFGGVGIEFNSKGQRCRRDKARNLYPIDAHGTKVVNRESSRPDEIPPHVWWKTFKQKDREKLHEARNAEIALEASRGSTDAPPLVAAPGTPVPDVRPPTP
eukprot:486367-Heterocapsa_arctica.AAC.1